MYYTVLKGFSPGIYSNWPEAKEQISGYSNAKYKKFKSLIEAEYYYKTKGGTFEKFQELIIEEDQKKIKKYKKEHNSTNNSSSTSNFKKIKVNTSHRKWEEVL